MIVAAFLVISAYASTNTNNCLGLLGPTKQCFSPNSNLNTCCPAIKAFNNNQCFCNKLASDLIAQNATIISKMLKTCGEKQLPCDCFINKTYDGGKCLNTDEELDLERFKTAETFAKTILSFPFTPGCFNYSKFRNSLKSLLEPEIVARAGQGLGVYQGIDHVAEYFSLLSPKVNKHFVSVVPAVNPKKIANISADGKTLTIGLNVVNTYLNGTYKRNSTDYLETVFKFQNCSTKAIELKVPSRSTLFPGKPTGVSSLTEMLYLAINSNRIAGAGGYSFMGFRSICKEHEKYCVGSNKQFADEHSCLIFLRNLPNVSPACGASSLGSGNTGTCRAKHQFMVQIRPEVHCQHIGIQSTTCSETKCYEPGIAADVQTNLNTVGQNLTNALYKMNMNLNYQYFNGNWTFAEFC